MSLPECPSINLCIHKSPMIAFCSSLSQNNTVLVSGLFFHSCIRWTFQNSSLYEIVELDVQKSSQHVFMFECYIKNNKVNFFRCFLKSVLVSQLLKVGRFYLINSFLLHTYSSITITPPKIIQMPRQILRMSDICTGTSTYPIPRFMSSRLPLPTIHHTIP